MDSNIKDTLSTWRSGGITHLGVIGDIVTDGEIFGSEGVFSLIATPDNPVALVYKVLNGEKSEDYNVVRLNELNSQKTFGGSDRADLPDSAFLYPEDRSFPVVTKQDVVDAVYSFGRSKGKNFADFKNRLIKRAKAIGATSALPENWRTDSAMNNSTTVGRKIDVNFLPYDTRDTDGKYFSRKTNKHLLDKLPAPPVIDGHGFAMGNDVTPAGHILNTWETDKGYWASIELDPKHPNYNKYLSALENNKLYVSSGGAPTYFRMNKDGMVTDWATVEISLIPEMNGNRPKNWYAVAIPTAEKILNSISAPSKLTEDSMDEKQLTTPTNVGTADKAEIRGLRKFLQGLLNMATVLETTDQEDAEEIVTKEIVKDDLRDALNRIELLNAEKLACEEGSKNVIAELNSLKAKATTCDECRNSLAEELMNAADTQWLNSLGDKIAPAERDGILNSIREKRKEAATLNSGVDIVGEFLKSVVGRGAIVGDKSPQLFAAGFVGEKNAPQNKVSPEYIERMLKASSVSSFGA